MHTSSLKSAPPSSAADSKAQAVVGTLLAEFPAELPPYCAKLLANAPDSFDDERYGLVALAIRQLRDAGKPVAPLTVREHLESSRNLDAVGGAVFVETLTSQAVSLTIAEYEATDLWASYRGRQLKSVYNKAGAAMEADPSKSDAILGGVRHSLDALDALEAANVDSSTTMSFSQGMGYDTANDPNTLLGLVEGKTTRYLCRGKGAWLIGPSGLGKSVLLYQAGCLFTLGRPLFGITPIRPLRVLILQAENDEGDTAEMMQGAGTALRIDAFSPEADILDANLKVITECSSTGQQFCRRLGREIEKFQADLALVDPLLSFAGIDVSRQDQCSAFLRGWLNPMLHDTGAGLIGAHHTGKPKAARDMRGMTDLDYAYQGLGSSELVNWARAVMLIKPHADVFELKLLKRGTRAGATHPDGQPTTSVWLRHSAGRLWWEQVAPPVEAENEKSAPGGRPSKVEEVLALGLGKLIDSLIEPASQNEVAKRIESFAAKASLDVSLRTCKKVVSTLVANKAIRKNEDGNYVKS